MKKRQQEKRQLEEETATGRDSHRKSQLEEETARERDN